MGKQKQTGFSLIELLVVISIIGLLASIGLVYVSKVRIRARNVIRKTDIKEMHKVLELYYSDNGAYPMPSSPDNLHNTEEYLKPYLIPQYGTKLPRDPSLSYYLYGWSNSGEQFGFLIFFEEEDGPNAQYWCKYLYGTGTLGTSPAMNAVPPCEFK